MLQVLAANDEFGDECTDIALERTSECLEAMAAAIDACGKDERSAIEVMRYARIAMCPAAPTPITIYSIL